MLSDVMEHLGKVGKRQESFLILVEHIMKCENPFIVETGTMRTEDNYEGDGMSSLLWYNVLGVLGKGNLLSIDANPEATNFARTKCKDGKYISSDFRTGDSVESLKKYYSFGSFRKIDLLYLDSVDMIFPDPTASFLHTLFEYLTVKEYLAPNALICVDDNIKVVKDGTDKEVFVSKGEFLRQYMEKIGNTPIHESYQIIWRNK